jgi:hypothetical protein
MGGLTLDTGALIALERTRKRIREIVAAAQAGKDRITVPAVATTEWWRGPDWARTCYRSPALTPPFRGAFQSFGSRQALRTAAT